MKRARLKRWLKPGLGALAVLFLAAQLVPVDRTNPPLGTEVDAPAEVVSVLRASCYDCHSNETTWPWYSRIAPASWLVVKDVREGREHVNYSTWGHYSAEERAEKQAETWEDVAEGEMPLGIYTLMHPDARLSEADRTVLRDWGLQASHAEGGDGEGHEEDSETGDH